MSGGSEIKDDLREHYTLLPAGMLLWHSYPSRYDARAFNPRSRGRFAILPPPDRGMFYVGDSSACVLWESILRNLVVERSQPQLVDADLVQGWSLARLRLARDTPILDLRAPHFRNLSTSPARHTEWQRLAVVAERDYGQTHSAATELLCRAPRAAGLCWHSRQIGAQTAYVFYSPPLTSGDFELIEMIELIRLGGWALIDQALDAAGVERLGAETLSNELFDELPVEEPDDG
jgi:hypothetical protein